MLKHCGTRTIYTKRLKLRKFRMEDIGHVFANWAGDPDNVKYLDWAAHAGLEKTKSVVLHWLERYLSLDYYRWCITFIDEDEPIGAIDVMEVNERTQTAALGYVLSKKYWNQGFMTEVLIAIEDFLFDEVGFNRVEAYHDVSNIASGRIMAKSGMKFEGISRRGGLTNLGKFCDMANYAILKGEHKTRGI